MNVFVCGAFDNGTDKCCKYCKHFMLWGVSTGYCDIKDEDMQSSNSCDRFEKENEHEHYNE